MKFTKNRGPNYDIPGSVADYPIPAELTKIEEDSREGRNIEENHDLDILDRVGTSDPSEQSEDLKNTINPNHIPQYSDVLKKKLDQKKYDALSDDQKRELTVGDPKLNPEIADRYDDAYREMSGFPQKNPIIGEQPQIKASMPAVTKTQATNIPISVPKKSETPVIPSKSSVSTSTNVKSGSTSEGSTTSDQSKDKIPPQSDLEFLKAEYEKLKEQRQQAIDAARLSDTIQSFGNIFSVAARRPEFIREANASAAAAQYGEKELSTLLDNYNKLKSKELTPDQIRKIKLENDKLEKEVKQMGQLTPAQQAELDLRKQELDLKRQHLNMDKKSKGLDLTPEEKKIDAEMAKTFSNWETKGRKELDVNIQKLEEAKKLIKNSGFLTQGRYAAATEGTAFEPKESRYISQLMNTATMQALQALKGATSDRDIQFAKQNAYDPLVGEKNIQKIDYIINTLKNEAKNNDYYSNLAKKYGTTSERAILEKHEKIDVPTTMANITTTPEEINKFKERNPGISDEEAQRAIIDYKRKKAGK